MELPKKKRPPRNIWHNEYLLNKWFEEVFDDKRDAEEVMEFSLNEVD